LTRLFFFSALLALSIPLAAAPISPATHAAIMRIADTEGVPRSVANWLQVEESGNWRTGAWGDASAVSREEVRGYHSRGLYQLFEEPSNLDYLLAQFWTGRGECERFDILNPIHSAKVGLRYMEALHRSWGSWYLAACHYNGCNGKPSEETWAYALRIILARNP